MSAAPANSRPRGRFRWHQLYFALAAFDLVTISFSLFLNHRLIDLHDESVRVNQEWATRLSKFSDVAQAGGAVNAPGNDVFDSHDVDAESARLRAALREFDHKLAAAEADLSTNVAPTEIGALWADVKLVREAMKEMVDEAELIFSYFRQNLPNKAGERMATMDRKYAKLNGGFAQLSGHVRAIQAQNFGAQQAASAELRQYEWSIAGAIVLIVLAVTMYGHRMSKTMSAVMEENERYLRDLQGAHAGLEQRVQERTADLRDEMNRRELAQSEAEEAQKQLVAASRQAGMAEVATGVLHNVGNVLNSVTVSAGVVLEKLRRSKAPKVAQAAELLTGRNGGLAEYLTQDENGQKLPGYLARLGQHLVVENEQLLSEVNQLSRNIEHIKEIVAMQQSYAKVSGVFEMLPAERLVEDAIAMNSGAFERHGVTVERQFHPAPLARVDKHKVLQILINLLRNAKYALDDASRPDKRITISIEPAGEQVRIAVADNGIGIASENLTRIFGHGFTTRQDGHGFGLHSGANAATEMGGTLTATSAGLGHGATFTLDLPLATARA